MDGYLGHFPEICPKQYLDSDYRQILGTNPIWVLEIFVAVPVLFFFQGDCYIYNVNVNVRKLLSSFSVKEKKICVS
jgi:hypothetical protein